MPCATGIHVSTNNLPFVVDVEYCGTAFDSVHCAWKIDGSERARYRFLRQTPRLKSEQADCDQNLANTF